MTKKLVAVAAVVGAATAVFGSGVASADPDVAGLKYSDAQTQVQQAGLTARVSARVGDRLSEGDCIVTSSTRSAAPDSGFGSGGDSLVLIALDCNGVVASATNPGYSAASPEGREAAKQKKLVEWRQTENGQLACRQYESQHPEAGSIPGCNPEGDE
jgi:hypothetical protein